MQRRTEFILPLAERKNCLPAQPGGQDHHALVRARHSLSLFPDRLGLKPKADSSFLKVLLGNIRVVLPAAPPSPETFEPLATKFQAFEGTEPGGGAEGPEPRQDTL